MHKFGHPTRFEPIFCLRFGNLIKNSHFRKFIDLMLERMELFQRVIQSTLSINCEGWTNRINFEEIIFSKVETIHAIHVLKPISLLSPSRLATRNMPRILMCLIVQIAKNINCLNFTSYEIFYALQASVIVPSNPILSLNFMCSPFTFCGLQNSQWH